MQPFFKQHAKARQQIKFEKLIHNFKFRFDCGYFLSGIFADGCNTGMANQHE